jgi:hypothetical protein
MKRTLVGAAAARAICRHVRAITERSHICFFTEPIEVMPLSYMVFVTSTPPPWGVLSLSTACPLLLAPRASKPP